MFLTAALRSKLVSLLRPWLDGEPELELELGFLTWTVRAKNLVISATSLNPSIEKSTKLVFKRFEVGELKARISLWSSPPLLLEMRGINVVLAPGESAGDWRPEPRDLAAERRKEVIAAIDPEGASLHEIIGGSLVVASSGHWLIKSLANTVVRHCQVQLGDIHLKLQCTQSHACLLEISDLLLEPQLPEQNFLFRGFVNLVSASGKQMILLISCNTVKFSLQENAQLCCITSLMGFSAAIRLDDLQPRNYSLKLASVDFQISPIIIPTIMIISDLFSTEALMGNRNGQDLWKIVRVKIGHSTLLSRLNMCKVGNTVVVWSRYVRIYESLLLLVGYSDHKAMEEIFSSFSCDSKLLKRVKHQWGSVCELEEHLPAEAVARARRIARHRALLSGSIDMKLSTNIATTSLVNILSPVLLVWRAICTVLHLIVQCFMWPVLKFYHGLSRNPVLFLPTFPTYESQFHFSLNLEEFYFTCSHAIAFPVNGKGHVGSSPPIMKFPSICLCIKSSFLIYAADFFSNTLLAASGELKLHISSSARGSTLDKVLESMKNRSVEGLNLDSGIENVVLWSEPAVQFHPPERVVIGSSDPVESTPILVLEHNTEDLWSSWDKIRVQCEDIDIQLNEQPFVICELKSFLVDPYHNRGNYGLWKCSFTLGKFNFDLDYSSILSTVLLLKELQNYHRLTASTERAPDLADPSSVVEVETEIKVQDMINLYTSKMKVNWLSVLPEKNIQVGAFIVGPNVRVSFDREYLGDAKQDLNPIFAHLENDKLVLEFNIENIEFVVWPTAKSILAALTRESNFDESAAEYLWMKKPPTVQASIAHSIDRFVSQGRVAVDAFLRLNGLTAFVNDLELNQKYHVAKLMPVIVQSSACRDYLHSLSPTVDVLSISPSVFTTGIAILLQIDKLCTVLQVIEGMLSGVSSINSHFEPVALGFSRNFNKKSMPSIEEGIQNNTMDAGATACTVITESTQIYVDVYLHLELIDIILIGIDNYHDKRNFIEPQGTFKSFTLSSSEPQMATVPDMFTKPMLAVGLFIRKSSFNIYCEDNHVDILIDLCGIQSDIFGCQNSIGVCTDILQIRSLLSQRLDHLYQFALSKCIFSFRVGSRTNTSHSASDNGDGLVSGNGRASYAAENYTSHSEESISQAHVAERKLKRDQLIVGSTPGPASPTWILAELGFGEVFLAEHSMKNLVIGASQTNELKVSVLISEELDTINCNIQGGYVFIESAALSMFILCFKDSLFLITKCFNASGQSSRETGKSLDTEETAAGWSIQLHDEDSRETVAPASYQETEKSLDSEVTAAQQSIQLHDEDARETVAPAPCTGMHKGFKRNFLKSLTIDVTQLSIVLAVTDGSGGARELIVEVDMSLDFLSFGRKLLLDLSRLTIFTKHLRKSLLYPKRDPILPHFLLDNSTALSSNATSENCTSPESCSSLTRKFEKEGLVEIGSSNISPPDLGSYILEHLTAAISVEKTSLKRQVDLMQLNSNWFGRGRISGFCLTIRLSEIQMLSDLYAPLSGIFGSKASANLNHEAGSINHERTTDPDYTIPDGAIVAITDIHQHMYFAAEAVDKKYHIVGALHYSLVGERALFRVRYHKRWMSHVSWISFASLYAKNEEGTPLCLNFSPGSGYVEISSSDDKGWALWQTLPCNFDDCEDDDLKSYNIYSKKAFHLVNRKNDCAIAFVDGRPEFVKKPGNPFKIKVFNEFTLVRGIGRLDVPNEHFDVANDTNGRVPSCIGEDISGHCSDLPYLNLIVDEIIFCILNEVSDANDSYPLIQGCIKTIFITGQILSSKLRITSSFNMGINYFDADKNMWKEIISPINTCLFYRSRFTDQDSTNSNHGVPVNFYFRMSQVRPIGMKSFLFHRLFWVQPTDGIFCSKFWQVDIFLTEISLDVLLYLAGKLDIAGPFDVRSSVIFPNCCKIENHSGLSLLCHFANDQDVKIAGKKSASIFLRNVPWVGHHKKSENLVSVCLTEGQFSTSPINVSLLEAHVFAWRARVLSLLDSRSFPGPLVVVEVSKKSEEGLSLIISPLLRIHNESEFSMELCFRRPQEKEKESASTLLRHGDTIDDSMAVFDALDLSGGPKKALMSLTLGNFLLSIRPEITEYTGKNGEPYSVNWSDDLKGGKPIRVSGIFDKLNYKLKKAFSVASVKSTFSSLHCPLLIGGQHVSDVYFLIQTIGREVPVMQPPNTGDTSDSKNLPVVMQVQKQIFIYPTVQVHNLLQAEIHVLLSATRPEMSSTQGFNTFGREATIPCGSSAYFYANPAMLYFTVTLTAHSSSCKPVNSADWVKKLHKQKSEVHYLDVTLDFEGKYSASLRLSCADRGILEGTVFTAYSLKNETEFLLYGCTSNQKPLPWEEDRSFSTDIPPELGCFLPPNSTRSWFLKSNKLHLKWMGEGASKVTLDLDILSGFTELSLEAQDGHGVKRIARVGISVQPCMHKVSVPSQLICIVPRYVICNESNECIIVRQCYLEDDLGWVTSIGGKQKATLQVRNNTHKSRNTSFFDSILKTHRNVNEDSHTFVQFRPEDIRYGWSGPLCVASLGRFFLKFRGQFPTLENQTNPTSQKEERNTQFAAVQIVEEKSSLVLHVYLPPNVMLPYRIKNSLRQLSIIYYQKESSESDVLGSGRFEEYVWEDLNLPHMLIVQIVDMDLLREINIDKICTWKPFFKLRQNKRMILQLPLGKRFGGEKRTDESHGLGVFDIGYEVYADGLTRVLHICERADSYKEEILQPSANFQLRVSNFGMHLLENNSKQDITANEVPVYSTIIIARIANITLDSLITEKCKYYFIRVQTLNVDEKWEGAPFASMVRLHDFESNESVLRVIFVLQSTNSSVKQIKYSSIILQPIDLRIDEETLMRLVPFWRTSLSTSTQSRQFYFRHFEIHPIKIIASFLPGTPYASYSSAQEALRSLLHSVIKVPAINNSVVELNGVLLTHALLTSRELLIKCAQHYSWYVVRAVYKTKGSLLLPPAFASIFDDTASSSLDVFFDPSDGSINFPGLTIGMFKVISKCIDSKGFSGSKRYFGDLGKAIKTASSNALFAAVTEISDNVLRGAETSGFNGMVHGFHQGILRLAMEPSLLGAALMEGGPDRKIKLDRSPGVDELFIEGYLQAMLDVTYKQQYLRVRVIDDQVVLKNLPPNSSVINDIVEDVKSFLVSKALLKGDDSIAPRPLRHLQNENEWKIGPTVLTLCEHLFVSFAVRMLREQSNKFTGRIRLKGNAGGDKEKPSRKWAVGRFILSGMLAYLDGRLCRHIPNPIARRIVSGFLLSFLDQKDTK